MNKKELQVLQKVLASEKTNFAPEDRAEIEEIIEASEPTKELVLRIATIVLKYLQLLGDFFNTD